MKKIISLITVVAMAAAVVLIPTKEVKASDYVLTSQAQDLYYRAQSELSSAQRDRDYAQSRVDSLRNSGISGAELDSAINELYSRNDIVNKKIDKVNKARYVLDFVNTRSDSEIFLAQMQEKFRNQASLKPMQDKIDGAKAIAAAQLTQINIIQDAIRSQTELAKTNPAILAQVNELNAAYQVELAQYQAELEAISQLQAQYDAFAKTMPMPTAADNMRLAEIRTDFRYACSQFDAACAE